jgi:signal transduction histidine kinase
MMIFSNIKLDQLMLDMSSDSQKNEIEKIKRNLDDTIEELRTMTIQISPPVLYEVGLIPALESLAEQFESRYGLTCHFEDDRVEKPVTDDVRNMLFQGVKELLTNITKHAKADNVWVQVKKEDKNILIEVKDDGCGFHPSKMVPDSESNSGFGLFNIKERIEFLKGSFHVHSEKNQGACIQLRAPLKR